MSKKAPNPDSMSAQARAALKSDQFMTGMQAAGNLLIGYPKTAAAIAAGAISLALLGCAGESKPVEINGHQAVCVSTEDGQFNIKRVDGSAGPDHAMTAGIGLINKALIKDGVPGVLPDRLQQSDIEGAAAKYADVIAADNPGVNVADAPRFDLPRVEGVPEDQGGACVVYGSDGLEMFPFQQK